MTELYKNKYRISSTRLPGFDYGQPGYYFITICTKNRLEYFGNIINEKMLLNNIGKIVENELIKTPKIRNNVMIDEFIVMPNHIHIIIVIAETNQNGDKKTTKTHDNDGGLIVSVETHCNASLHSMHNNNHSSSKPDNELYQNKFGPQKNNLASIIRGFKSSATKIINETYGYNFFAWQPRFYDHIIRDEQSLNKIRQYIKDNPKMWWRDKNNPEGLLM